MRLVPDGLREIFQGVAPEPPVRPQGGGHRRCDDLTVLAAIIFGATSGCTWRQVPPVFGRSTHGSSSAGHMGRADRAPTRAVAPLPEPWRHYIYSPASVGLWLLAMLVAPVVVCTVKWPWIKSGGS